MHVITIFIWFIIYSILGWIYETIYCSITKKQWDNRGMLIGPYCPIYGVGAVLDVLFLSHLPNWYAVFFAAMLGSAVLEFSTSYTTEKLFHAVWWDYSDLPLNIQGRIALPCTIGFGAAGVLILYGIQPYISRFTDMLPIVGQEPVALLFMAVFAADCALTADSLMSLNVKLAAITTEMDSHVSEKYDAFLENLKRTREKLEQHKGKLSLEEFREKLLSDELDKLLSGMNWVQSRAFRSPASFRRSHHSKLINKVKSNLSRRRKADTNVDSGQ